MVHEVLSAAELLNDLASGVPSRQYEAYLALGNLRRTEEIDAVVDAYRNGHHGVRSYVGRYLADLATKHSLGRLWELAVESEGGERRVFLDILMRVPESNLDKADVLVEHLVSPDPELALFCVKSLSRSRSPKAVMPLSHLYEKAPDPLRVEILKTLEDIRDTRSLDVARDAITSKDVGVICQGLHLLRALGSERDTKAVVRLMDHAEPRVREYACWNLSKERRAGAEEALRRLAEKDQDPAVRAAAAKTLMTYEGSATATSLLAAVATDPSLHVRMVAAFSLASHLGDETTSVLLAALDSTRKELRRSAIDHLALRGARRSLRALRGILKGDGDLGLRCGAASALGHIGEPEVAPELEACLDQEIPLAYASAQALCRLLNVHHLDEIARLIRRGGPREVQHVFASHAAKLGHVMTLNEGILVEARKWAVSEDEDLLYFGIDILGRSGQPGDFPLVVGALGAPVLALHGWQALRHLASRHLAAFQAALAAGTDVPAQFWSVLRTLRPSEAECREWFLVMGRHHPSSDGEIPLSAHDVLPQDVDESQPDRPADEEIIWPEDVLPADPRPEGWEPDDKPVDEGERIDIGGLDVEVVERAPAERGSAMEFLEPSGNPVEPSKPSRVEAVPMSGTPRGLRPWAVMLGWARRHPELLTRLAAEGHVAEILAADALRRLSRSRALVKEEKALVAAMLPKAQGHVLDLLLAVVAHASPPEALGPLLDLSLKQSHAGARSVLGRMLGGSHGL